MLTPPRRSWPQRMTQRVGSTVPPPGGWVFSSPQPARNQTRPRGAGRPGARIHRAAGSTWTRSVHHGRTAGTWCRAGAGRARVTGDVPDGDDRRIYRIRATGASEVCSAFTATPTTATDPEHAVDCERRRSCVTSVRRACRSTRPGCTDHQRATERLNCGRHSDQHSTTTTATPTAVGDAITATTTPTTAGQRERDVTARRNPKRTDVVRPGSGHAN